MEKTYEDKRDWKEYEANLRERKANAIGFLLRKPTLREFECELAGMNRDKPGGRFHIPESIVICSLFLKHKFRIDDRTLILFIEDLILRITGYKPKHTHSAIVKRRMQSDFKLPFAMASASVEGKTLYADGMCLRMGRGGNYRDKRYATGVRYLKILLFTDEKYKVVDFTIGDELDAEVNLYREKKEEVENSGAAAFCGDGAFAALDVVTGCVKHGIKPVIRAAEPSVERIKRKPPPENCIKKRRDAEIIWDNYVEEQTNYEVWKKKTGYSKRWVHSEGVISTFKRSFGEEVICTTQKGMHDEVCIKLMELNGDYPKLWQ